MKRQGGFTLIELVVVIVILGILAVTAAPRFLNLQGDARASALQGLRGSMAGASGIVYGKSAIQGIEKSISGTVDGNVEVVYGYPAPSATGIGNAIESNGDFAVIDGHASAADDVSVVYSFTGSSTDSKCVVVYKMTVAESASGPSITVADANDC